MQVIARKVGDTLRPSRIIPTILKGQIEKTVFNSIAPGIKKHILLRGKLGDGPVFCIVHWNAPDFLLLNVTQIESLYPTSKIYILDNGSQKANLDAVEEELKHFNNVTLFAVSPSARSMWKMRIGLDRLLYSHAKGLQFLLNYAAEERDEIAVFLDQDCILCNNIDNLFAKFGKNVILIGTRYGRSNNLVHASFMILQPKRVNQLFGSYSFFCDSSEHYHGPSETYHESLEPYHGLSLKTGGRILLLEWKYAGAVSSYSFQDKIYAWHAGYSSRTVGYSAKDHVDGLSVSFRQESRKVAFEFMKQIHEETINKSPICRARLCSLPVVK
jgi:hypothetical protein